MTPPRTDAYRPFIVPVFIPHAGCPHRCAFCNQRLVTGAAESLPSAQTVSDHIRSFLKYKQTYHSPVQISFYGGNFLGLTESTLLKLLEAAAGFVAAGQADSIRFSTRPDSVTPHRIEIIREFPVKTVELGAQSMADRVLKLSRRGHTPLHTKLACSALRAYDYEIGLQMMVGLPGDDEVRAMQSARDMAALEPDFIRIYPTLVLKNSLLAEWYLQGSYTPLSLASAVALVKDLYLYFQQKGIPVVRMGLQTSAETIAPNSIVAGPYHPAFGHLVLSEVFYGRATALLAAEGAPFRKAAFKVHPNSIPKLRGLKNDNLLRLKAAFQLNSIEVVPDASLSADMLRLEVTRQ